MDGKISHDCPSKKKNDRKSKTLNGNETNFCNDRSKTFMTRMDQFEKEINRRLEKMEVKIRNS